MEYEENPFQGKNKEDKLKQVWELQEDSMAGDRITRDQLVSRIIPIEIMEGITLQEGEIEGKYLKLHSKKGTILTESMLYEGEPLSDDLRLHNYNFVALTEHLAAGNYVDIRISFLNGSDFIILSKKKILSVSLYNQAENIENALWLQVTEEEILRLASAVVDSYLHEGCYIYAIEYVAETQNAAMINYPVNDVVRALIEENPNIVEHAKNVLAAKLREQLEAELEIFQNKEENAVTNIENVTKDDVLEEHSNQSSEEEKIEFLD